MSWIALTEQNVLDRLAPEERDSYEEAGKGDDVTPRLPGIMLQVTDMIRDTIAQNGSNYLGEDGTLPRGAIYHAAVLCRLALIGSQPTNEGETTPREREDRAALDYVKDIRNKVVTFPIVIPPRQPDAGAYGGKPLMDF